MDTFGRGVDELTSELIQRGGNHDRKYQALNMLVLGLIKQETVGLAFGEIGSWARGLKSLFLHDPRKQKDDDMLKQIPSIPIYDAGHQVSGDRENQYTGPATRPFINLVKPGDVQSIHYRLACGYVVCGVRTDDAVPGHFVVVDREYQHRSLVGRDFLNQSVLPTEMSRYFN